MTGRAGAALGHTGSSRRRRRRKRNNCTAGQTATVAVISPAVSPASSPEAVPGAVLMAVPEAAPAVRLGRYSDKAKAALLASFEAGASPTDDEVERGHADIATHAAPSFRRDYSNWNLGDFRNRERAGVTSIQRAGVCSVTQPRLTQPLSHRQLPTLIHLFAPRSIGLFASSRSNRRPFGSGSSADNET